MTYRLWPWKRNPRDHEAEIDLAHARVARAAAEQRTEVTRARWRFVAEVVEGSREIRRENHIVEDIKTILRGR